MWETWQGCGWGLWCCGEQQGAGATAGAAEPALPAAPAGRGNCPSLGPGTAGHCPQPEPPARGRCPGSSPGALRGHPGGREEEPAAGPARPGGADYRRQRAAPPVAMVTPLPAGGLSPGRAGGRPPSLPSRRSGRCHRPARPARGCGPHPEREGEGPGPGSGGQAAGTAAGRTGPGPGAAARAGAAAENKAAGAGARWASAASAMAGPQAGGSAAILVPRTSRNGCRLSLLCTRHTGRGGDRGQGAQTAAPLALLSGVNRARLWLQWAVGAGGAEVWLGWARGSRAGGGGPGCWGHAGGGRRATGAHEVRGGGKQRNVGLEEMGKTKDTGEEKDLMDNPEERR